MKIFTKKRAVAAGAAVAILGGSMGAWAYFTAQSGSGSHSAPVGTSTQWQVSVGAFSANLYPGGPSTTATYTITNPSAGNQGLTGVTASVASSGGEVTTGGTPVTGCLASWFSASAGAPASGLNTSIAPGANTTGTVTVTMSNVNSVQDACKSATPDITVTAA